MKATNFAKFNTVVETKVGETNLDVRRSFSFNKYYTRVKKGKLGRKEGRKNREL